ncbi:hypothetical protein GCM10027580_24330 [Corynebacterium faecale]
MDGEISGGPGCEVVDHTSCRSAAKYSHDLILMQLKGWRKVMGGVNQGHVELYKCTARPISRSV